MALSRDARAPSAGLPSLPHLLPDSTRVFETMAPGSPQGARLESDACRDLVPGGGLLAVPATLQRASRPAL
eukprot:5477108-Alexandrium_andersonii.AAC.1